MAQDSADGATQQQFVIVPMWVLDLEIKPTALRVYCVIRSFADTRTGECFPSRKLIASRAMCSVAAVDNAVRELVELGAISVKKRKSASGDWTSNLYTLHAQRRRRRSRSSPQDHPQVDKKTTPPSSENMTTGGTENVALTRSIPNQNQYPSDYAEKNQREGSMSTEGSASPQVVVDGFLRTMKQRSRNL